MFKLVMGNYICHPLALLECRAGKKDDYIILSPSITIVAAPPQFKIWEQDTRDTDVCPGLTSSLYILL